MFSLLNSGWLPIGVGMFVFAILPFSLARLAKEPDERKRRVLLFSRIGVAWVALSMILDGLAMMFPAHGMLLNGLSMLCALVGLGFILRGLWLRGEKGHEA